MDPNKHAISLGLLLISTDTLLRYKDIATIPPQSLEILVRYKLIKSSTDFTLTRLGVRFLAQAEKDLLKYI